MVSSVWNEGITYRGPVNPTKRDKQWKQKCCWLSVQKNWKHVWCSRKLMCTLVQPKIERLWGVQTSCLTLKQVVLLWPLEFFAHSSVLTRNDALEKKWVADSFVECNECMHVNASTCERFLSPSQDDSSLTTFSLQFSPLFWLTVPQKLCQVESCASTVCII